MAHDTDARADDPDRAEDLRAEYAQIEWIVAGDVLEFAALLITGGRLGDIFGRKRIFLIGMGGFTTLQPGDGLPGRRRNGNAGSARKPGRDPEPVVHRAAIARIRVSGVTPTVKSGASPTALPN